MLFFVFKSKDLQSVINNIDGELNGFHFSPKNPAELKRFCEDSNLWYLLTIRINGDYILIKNSRLYEDLINTYSQKKVYEKLWHLSDRDAKTYYKKTKKLKKTNKVLNLILFLLIFSLGISLYANFSTLDSNHAIESRE